jgi:hypothetical protein
MSGERGGKGDGGEVREFRSARVHAWGGTHTKVFRFRARAYTHAHTYAYAHTTHTHSH